MLTGASLSMARAEFCLMPLVSGGKEIEIILAGKM